MTRTKLQQCDCTARCGDDPWIEQKKSEPCKRYKAYMAEIERERKTQELLTRLGHTSVLEALRELASFRKEQSL